MMDQIHKLQQNNLKILTLIQLVFNLLNERDPLQMLTLFSHTTCSLMQAQSMTVGIIEDAEHLSGNFCITTITNNQIDSRHSNTCSLNDALLRPLYCGQNVLRYSELSSSQLNNNNQMNTFSNRSFLGVPIRSSTQTYGIIYFIGKHNETEFNKEDEYIAEIIAAELALLYENIKVHDNLQQYINKLQLEIIDLKNIETDLRYNEERIQLALEAGLMNGWSWDFKTNEIKEFGFFDLLSRSRAGIERNHFNNFINRVIPEDREHVLETIDQAIKHGMSIESPFRALDINNNIKDYYTTGQVFYDEQKNAIRMIGVTVIITKLKKIEELLRRNQMKLAQTAHINSMGEMASTLAHELNQPLTVINAYICGCLRRIENNFQEITPIIEAMIKVKKNVELAEEILHRMKEFVHKDKLQYNTLNINEVIKKAVALIHYEGFPNLSATILFALTENLPDIQVDKIHIIQVLLNIIRNSIEAMSITKSKPPLIIIRSAQINSNTIAITVEDSGPGIDADTSTLLFKPDFSTKPDGKGMGLVIAHAIISAHDGQLRAYNLPEGGACFEFTLPIRDHKTEN